MPTAKSADSRQSHTHTTDSQLRVPDSGAALGTTPRRPRRAWTLAIGAVLGVSFVLPGATVQAPVVEAAARPNGCSGWNSTVRPPHSIRVLRRRSGRVERVSFRRYVTTVMGKEWPSYLPQSVVEAGAVATKQYGWYHAMGRTARSPRGQCFDVKDGVSDQLYKPGKARVRADHHSAVSKTWNVRLLKNGRLFMTGYRSGSNVRCGRDHTGYKLYARSASNCARRGYGYLEILRRYYGPNLQIVNGGGSSTSGQRSAQVSTSASTFSGQIQSRGDRPRPTSAPASRPSSDQQQSSPDRQQPSSDRQQPSSDRTRPSSDRGSSRPDTVGAGRERPSRTPAVVTTLLNVPFAVDAPLELIARRGSGVGLGELAVYLNDARIGSIPLSA